KAENGHQDDGECTDAVAGQDAIEDGGALDHPNDDEGERCNDSEHAGREHHSPLSNRLTRASMAPSSTSMAPLRSRACTVSTLPLTSVVMVPGVSVMELA